MLDTGVQRCCRRKCDTSRGLKTHGHVWCNLVADLTPRCKAAYAEGLRIFYYENTFFANQDNFDSSVLLKFITQMRALGLETNYKGAESKRVTCTFRYHGFNWSNALTFMELVHQGRLPPRRKTAAERWTMGVLDTEDLTLSSMHDTVCHLAASPWHDVKALLEKQRVVLGSCDERWMLD